MTSHKCIKKWGNSFIIRLDKTEIKNLKLNKGEIVKVTIQTEDKNGN